MTDAELPPEWFCNLTDAEREDFCRRETARLERLSAATARYYTAEIEWMESVMGRQSFAE
jgi:hypothetical protein